MPRRGRPGLLLLLLAFALAGLVLWLSLRDGGDEHQSGAEGERAEEAAADDAPHLLGAAPTFRDTTDGGSESLTRGTEVPQERPRAKPELRRGVVRVLDPNGRPISRATVAFRVEDGETHRSLATRTGPDGQVKVVLPPGRLVKMSVTVSVNRKPRTLLERTDPEGLDFQALTEVEAAELHVLPIRTVDPSGLPRPGQRIHYRPRKEGQPPTNRWGATSDADGWCYLGPWAFGTQVEIRPGPRGLTSADIVDRAAWRTVVVDGTVVELMVGEAPKLRLDFPGAPPKANLEISVLDQDDGTELFPRRKHVAGKGIWTAPAIKEGSRLEIVVLAAKEGLCARLHDVVPDVLPHDVVLERGVTITGRLRATDAQPMAAAVVEAVGRGFAARTYLDASGRFRFAGLPDETFTLRVAARSARDDAARYEGALVRESDRHVVVPMGRIVRIGCRLIVPGVVDRPDEPRIYSIRATSSDWPGERKSLVFNGPDFALRVPCGRWSITVTSASKDGATLEGTFDVGRVDADREGVEIILRDAGR